jgi:hypothetical protein
VLNRIKKVTYVIYKRPMVVIKYAKNEHTRYQKETGKKKPIQ